MAKRKQATKKSSRGGAPLSAKEQFFYDRGGYSHDPKTETAEQGRRRMARDAARAMQIADELGWEFVWEDDQVPYDMGDAEDVMPDEVFVLVLKDAGGGVLESLGGIGFLHSTGRAENQAQMRVFESELAMQAVHALEEREGRTEEISG